MITPYVPEGRTMRRQTVKKPSADAAPGAGGTALSPIEIRRVSVLQKPAMKQRKKRRPGRPATGHDPIIPVRLPTKLVKDIDAWADVYRSETRIAGVHGDRWTVRLVIQLMSGVPLGASGSFARLMLMRHYSFCREV
jgi:hypothetical protein